MLILFGCCFCLYIAYDLKDHPSNCRVKLLEHNGMESSSSDEDIITSLRTPNRPLSSPSGFRHSTPFPHRDKRKNSKSLEKPPWIHPPGKCSTPRNICRRLDLWHCEKRKEREAKYDGIRRRRNGRQTIGDKLDDSISPNGMRWTIINKSSVTDVTTVLRTPGWDIEYKNFCKPMPFNSSLRRFSSSGKLKSSGNWTRTTINITPHSPGKMTSFCELHMHSWSPPGHKHSYTGAIKNSRTRIPLPKQDSKLKEFKLIAIVKNTSCIEVHQAIEDEFPTNPRISNGFKQALLKPNFKNPIIEFSSPTKNLTLTRNTKFETINNNPILAAAKQICSGIKLSTPRQFKEIKSCSNKPKPAASNAKTKFPGKVDTFGPMENAMHSVSIIHDGFRNHESTTEDENDSSAINIENITPCTNQSSVFEVSEQESSPIRIEEMQNSYGDLSKMPVETHVQNSEMSELIGLCTQYFTAYLTKRESLIRSENQCIDKVQNLVCEMQNKEKKKEFHKQVTLVDEEISDAELNMNNDIFIPSHDILDRSVDEKNFIFLDKLISFLSSRRK